MGRAYTEAQNFEYAAPFWAAAEKTEDVAQVTLARATSEISAGRLELAESLLREEIERTPEGLRLLPPLAAIHQMQPADCGLVEHMELLWTSGNHSPSTRREAAFALGKCFDDLGDYGRAMRYYDEANRLAYELSPLSQQFDTAAWRSYGDFQIRFFTKARMAELASNGHESSAPLFIVGMIRSGTTLTEHILSRHSQVRDIGETTFWPDHRGDLLDQNTGWCDKATAYRLAQEYLAMTAGGEARYFTEKNPANVLILPLIHCVLPNSRFVHVKRNAVDNLLSIWMTPMKTGLPFLHRPEHLVFAYKEYVRLLAHLVEVMPNDRFQTFTYEDLTSDPELTIESMLRYLNLEAEEDCFHPEDNKRTVHTPSVFQVRQPINRRSQERWRRYQPWLGPFSELLGC
jgi:tetratricopeptide (TPR) repeat protein